MDELRYQGHKSWILMSNRFFMSFFPFSYCPLFPLSEKGKLTYIWGFQPTSFSLWWLTVCLHHCVYRNSCSYIQKSFSLHRYYSVPVSFLATVCVLRQNRSTSSCRWHYSSWLLHIEARLNVLPSSASHTLSSGWIVMPDNNYITNSGRISICTGVRPPWLTKSYPCPMEAGYPPSAGVVNLGPSNPFTQFNPLKLVLYQSGNFNSVFSYTLRHELNGLVASTSSVTSIEDNNFPIFICLYSR